MTGVRRWPLVLIAAPAAVAVWSGWVGLAELCGFGVIHPLPGIVPGFQLNIAITLPIGVEAYGAYALGAWLAPDGVPASARTFAKRSAIGALLLGMLGQVVYHLLAAAHATRAPWPVVVLVSCLPVVSLGFGAALAHLLRSGTPENTTETVPDTTGEAVPEVTPVPARPATEAVPEVAPGRTRPVPKALPNSASRRRSGTRTRQPEVVFAAEIEAGTLPSVREVKRRMRVGQDKAMQIRDGLAALVPVSVPSETMA
jgi:hypothetical protein